MIFEVSSILKSHREPRTQAQHNNTNECQDDGRVEARAEVPHADAGDGRPGVLRDAVETATDKRDGAGMVRIVKIIDPERALHACLCGTVTRPLHTCSNGASS